MRKMMITLFGLSVLLVGVSSAETAPVTSSSSTVKNSHSPTTPVLRRELRVWCNDVFQKLVGHDYYTKTNGFPNDNEVITRQELRKWWNNVSKQFYGNVFYAETEGMKDDHKPVTWFYLKRWWNLVSQEIAGHPYYREPTTFER